MPQGQVAPLKRPQDIHPEAVAKVSKGLALKNRGSGIETHQTPPNEPRPPLLLPLVDGDTALWGRPLQLGLLRGKTMTAPSDPRRVEAS